MLRCISLKSTATKPSLSSSSSAPSLHRQPNPPTSTRSSIPHSISLPNITSTDHSPNSTTEELQDPLSLNREYALVVQANSFNEIREWILYQKLDEHSRRIDLVSPPLRPNRGSVDETLGRVRHTKLTRLVSTYFDHSEQTSHLLCFLLYQTLRTARSLYNPLHELLDVLPVDSVLTQPQCDRVFDAFIEFNHIDNPFPRPNSDSFVEMRRCFSNLKQQLDQRLRRAHTRSQFPHYAIRGSALCLVSFLKSPANVTLPSKFVKKQLHHVAQLDAAAIGAYVVNNELDTINCLVTRLHDLVESDKFLVRFGLARGRDRYPIQEVVKQLRKNQPNFLSQMKDLEDHVCICLVSVNRARSRLLEEIDRHETCTS